MGELTKAQKRFLGALVADPSSAPANTELIGSAAEMASRLAKRGLTRLAFRGYGQWIWEITLAGRQALKDQDHA
ncbi:MAG: hypothetical protein Q8R82_06685 [Hyphomonadaceae bacterium]|nr:hypothetical protein [Hyphomonadaceae bacterium]